MVPLPKLPARPQQPHFNRTFGRPENTRYVADTAIVEVAEIDHRLVFEIKQVQCLFQDCQVDVFLKKPLQAYFGLLAPVGRLSMDECDLALAYAREIHAVVMGNGKKPGGKFRTGLERAHFMDQFKKDIVRNVFGPGGVSCKCDAFLVNLHGIALIKLLKMTIVLRFKEKSN